MTAPGRSVRLARWALLGLAAAAALFALRMVGHAPATELRYVCPMHPEVRAAAPGQCPLCGMALVPVVPRAPVAEGGPRLPTGAVEAVRSRVVSEPLLAPAWVEGERLVARVYDDALPTLVPGDRLIFHPTAAPSSPVEVTATPGPFPRWDRSTSRVELRPAPGARLVRGTVGWVEGPARSRSQRMVSISALLEGPDGPYVLVRAGTGGFVRRPVRIGRTLDGSAAVVDGLEEGERVLVRSAFFVDAEQRLAAGLEAPAW